ncbi:NAD-dependent epimerase/dehydratase family protein [Mucilaginibacter ginkgonis]|uniref:GDP-mannose 4,6-dehydratase n=1 Tax=Mucilaginibacter ginkgonis TaxID=2682091 RepID=A0A6I4HUL7_9SPHI|nr:NAD-dependent epimerase/dehydratase family protein [Mucilaginibacter ginkgonis]QQL50202.1 GDP-mannose 4,6-dehydratase [Mucilaginibacter ginkgonis]
MTVKHSFIIIGAAGFLGSTMTAYLKEKGFEVYEILRGQISGIELDFNFLSNLVKVTNNPVVIDFSYTSVPNTSFQDPVKDYSENLYNVIRHLEFVKQLHNPTYVYISSGGTVYGNLDVNKAVDENYQNNPLSPYGITKLCCEKYVMMYNQVHNLKTKIIRPSNIYGPGQKPFRGQGIIANAIVKMLKGQPIQVFGNGDQVRDYLYVDDFTSAIFDVVIHGTDDIYNIGFGRGYSINDLIAKIEKLLNIPFRIEQLPFRPFDVQYNVLDTSRLKSLNNWSPETNIDEGLNQSISWLKNYLYSYNKA